jgi:hypothetical protein
MLISTQQDIHKTVQERKVEFSSLYARMDTNRKLCQLKRYRMVYPTIGHTFPNIVNGTFPTPDSLRRNNPNHAQHGKYIPHPYCFMLYLATYHYGEGYAD